MNHLNNPTDPYLFYNGPLALPAPAPMPLALPDSDTARALRSGMAQNWTHNKKQGTWYDQYGFEITRDDDQEKKYSLSKGNIFICRVHRINTAKMISTILINDTILYKCIQEQGTD